MKKQRWREMSRGREKEKERKWKETLSECAKERVKRSQQQIDTTR